MRKIRYLVATSLDSFIAIDDHHQSLDVVEARLRKIGDTLSREHRPCRTKTEHHRSQSSFDAGGKRQFSGRMGLATELDRVIATDGADNLALDRPGIRAKRGEVEPSRFIGQAVLHVGHKARQNEIAEPAVRMEAQTLLRRVRHCL